MRQDRRQELAGDVGVQKPVAVLRKHGWNPHRIVDAKPYEPAEQEIVLHLLHELAFRADREQNLDQRGAQQPLGRNRRAAIGGIKLGELCVERRQRGIHKLANLAERMTEGNAFLQIDVAEHRARLPILSTHANLLRHRAKGIIFALSCQQRSFFRAFDYEERHDQMLSR